MVEGVGGVGRAKIAEDGAIVVGASWGGIDALKRLFSGLSSAFEWPILVVLHQERNARGGVIEVLNEASVLPVVEAEEKQLIVPGVVYVAPANYHLLVETDGSLSLCISPKVNYCRPSIDVLFESAAEVYGDQLVGVVLTGANSDGARGAKYIKEKGGQVVVQCPDEAEMPAMPEAVLKATEVDFVLELKLIAKTLSELVRYVD